MFKTLQLCHLLAVLMASLPVLRVARAAEKLIRLPPLENVLVRNRVTAAVVSNHGPPAWVGITATGHQNHLEVGGDAKDETPSVTIQSPLILMPSRVNSMSSVYRFDLPNDYETAIRLGYSVSPSGISSFIWSPDTHSAFTLQIKAYATRARGVRIAAQYEARDRGSVYAGLWGNSALVSNFELASHFEPSQWSSVPTTLGQFTEALTYVGDHELPFLRRFSSNPTRARNAIYGGKLPGELASVAGAYVVYANSLEEVVPGSPEEVEQAFRTMGYVISPNKHKRGLSGPRLLAFDLEVGQGTVYQFLEGRKDLTRWDQRNLRRWLNAVKAAAESIDLTK